MAKDETSYTESITPEHDARGTLLDMIADGSPYLFITVDFIQDKESGEEGMAVKLHSGNGIHSKETTRILLEKVLGSLPE